MKETLCFLVATSFIASCAYPIKYDPLVSIKFKNCSSYTLKIDYNRDKEWDYIKSGKINCKEYSKKKQPEEELMPPPPPSSEEEELMPPEIPQ